MSRTADLRYLVRSAARAFRSPGWSISFGWAQIAIFGSCCGVCPTRCRMG